MNMHKYANYKPPAFLNKLAHISKASGLASHLSTQVSTEVSQTGQISLFCGVTNFFVHHLCTE